MKEEKVLIPSDGLTLEGLLSVQEALPVRGGVVLCHPHPLYGGEMTNPVISTAAEVAAEEGFQTLRFNFRGVGESEGTHADGVGEKDDVRAAIEFLSARVDGLPLILVGYSFGAGVGLPVAIEDARVKGMVAIAPPLEMYDFDFLKGSKKDKLVIVGNRDLYCPIERLKELYQQLEDPKSLVLIQGADHFFSYHVKSLTPPLREFFRSSLT
jgi:alpha/beta superfamily hydrolase